MIVQIVPYRDCLFLLDGSGAIFVVQMEDINLAAEPDPQMFFRYVRLTQKTLPPSLSHWREENK